MKEIKNVQGSQEIVQPLEFNIDTVYVRTNIIAVDTEEFTGWQYDEIQYGKDEYIAKIAQESGKANEQLLETQATLANLQEQILLSSGGM